MMHMLNNQPVSEEAYQTLINPMEAILSETDRLAANDARRFSADEVHRRLKEYARV